MDKPDTVYGSKSVETLRYEAELAAIEFDLMEEDRRQEQLFLREHSEVYEGFVNRHVNK